MKHTHELFCHTVTFQSVLTQTDIHLMLEVAARLTENESSQKEAISASMNYWFELQWSGEVRINPLPNYSLSWIRFNPLSHFVINKMLGLPFCD